MQRETCLRRRSIQFLIDSGLAFRVSMTRNAYLLSLPPEGAGAVVPLPSESAAVSGVVVADESVAAGAVPSAGSAPHPTTNITGDNKRLRAANCLNTLSVSDGRSMNGSLDKNEITKARRLQTTVLELPLPLPTSSELILAAEMTGLDFTRVSAVGSAWAKQSTCASPLTQGLAASMPRRQSVPADSAADCQCSITGF